MLKNNTVLKILSLLLAIAIWAFVIGEVNPTVKKTIHSVPIEFINAELLDDNDLTLANKDGYYVDVVVEGSRSDVVQLETEDITAQADLENVTKGENKVMVHVTVPSRISLEEVKTPEVTVVVEDLIKVKEVSLEVEVTGDPEGSPEVTIPQKVTIKGPAALIDDIASVTAEPVDIGDVTKTENIPLKLTLPDGIELAKKSKDIGIRIEY